MILYDRKSFLVLQQMSISCMYAAVSGPSVPETRVCGAQDKSFETAWKAKGTRYQPLFKHYCVQQSV